MENFNPIKELKPEDPFNAAEGESSDEIESIRLTLISTRKKTRELVNVIKKKNLDFVKDTTTIKDLDRRLRITIARIPIMRGDASTRSYQDEDPNMIFRTFNRRSRTTTTKPSTNPRLPPTPKFGERIKNAIIDSFFILFPWARGLKPGLKPGLQLFKRLGIKTGVNRTVSKKTLEKTLESAAANQSIKDKIFDNTRKIFDYFRKKFTPKIKPETLVKKSKYELRRENMRRVRLEGEKRIGLFDKKKNVKYENFFDRGPVKNAASDYTGPGDLIATQISRTVKNIKNVVRTKPNVNVTRSRRRNIKNLRGQDKVTYSDKVDLNAIRKESEKANQLQIDKYLDYLNKRIKELEGQLVKISGSKTVSEAEKKTRLLSIKRMLDELKGTRRTIKKRNPTSTKSETNRRIIRKRNPTSTKSETKAFNFNAKPTNNDIATLNRDTSVTNTRVFLMGEIT